MRASIEARVSTKSGGTVARGCFAVTYKGLTEDGTVELLGTDADGRRLSVKIPGEVLEEIDGPAIAESIREHGRRAEDAVLTRLRL